MGDKNGPEFEAVVQHVKNLDRGFGGSPSESEGWMRVTLPNVHEAGEEATPAVLLFTRKEWMIATKRAAKNPEDAYDVIEELPPWLARIFGD